MSTPERTSRPRRVILIGWVGALALVASVAIAAVAPGLSRAAKPATDSTPAAVDSTSQSTGKASCFGYVDVEQGGAPLYPALPGRVVEVMTKEGAVVQQGDPLFRVDDALAKLHLREAKTALDAAEDRLTQARSLAEQHKSKVAVQQAV